MSTGRIDSFLAQINDGGVAKNSHWDVQVNTPLSLLGYDFGAMSNILKFRCEAGELPGRQLVTNDVKVYGPIYRTAYQSLYTELNLTFIETEDMRVRRFMEAWMNTIYDSGSNILQYQSGYATEIIVTQYGVGPAGKAESNFDREIAFLSKEQFNQSPPGLIPVLRVNMHKAYPVNINQMSTAWSDDSPHRVQVSFFYEWYSMSPIAPSTEGRSEFVSEAPSTIKTPWGLDDTVAPWFTQQVKTPFKP